MLPVAIDVTIKLTGTNRTIASLRHDLASDGDWRAMTLYERNVREEGGASPCASSVSCLLPRGCKSAGQRRGEQNQGVWGSPDERPSARRGFQAAGRIQSRMLRLPVSEIHGGGGGGGGGAAVMHKAGGERV